jgi:hypothetical protein
VICCDARVLRRLLTTALGVVVLALSLPAVGAPAQASAPAAARSAVQAPAPECPPRTVEESTKNARAVFSGIVTAVEKQSRTDGLPGAIYEQTVTVDLVYQGNIDTETVQVQTDRNHLQCSLGELVTGAEYMFFVTGTPWFASGDSGTRVSDPTVVTQVEAVLGAGQPPVQPAPEKAVFTAVDTSAPESLSRTAAPGAALVLIGLLGLLLVRGLGRRAR